MRTLIPLCAAAAACVPALAVADVITLSPRKDATMLSDSPDRANALGPGLYLGRNSSGYIRRALLAFDLSSIPAGSTITAVTMSIRCTRAHGGTAAVQMHRLLADWGEAVAYVPDPGGNGTTAGDGDVTWTERFFNQSQPWTTEGGDFSPTTTSSVNISGSGTTYTWPSTAQFIADVQNMLSSPGSNFGWILTGNETTSGTAKRLASRENADTTARPRLVVTYSVPAPGAAGALLPVALVAARRRRPSR